MKRIFGLITICSVLALPVIAASPANFSGSGTAWTNDYGQHYVNNNNPEVRMDWANQHFAVPGEGGQHANENAAVIEWGSGSLVKPVTATDKHLIKKVLFDSTAEIESAKGGKGKPTGGPPGQNKDKPGEEQVATGIIGAEAAGEKYAVVIGICNYPGTVNDLCWSDGDSLNMYQALAELYGYADENIYLLRDMAGLNDEPVYDPQNITDGAATLANIEWAISDIEGKVNEGDEVVFFFSGHGGDGIAGDNDKERRDEAIIVHNGSKIVYLWDGQLRDRFSNFPTSRISFIFDSCLAGGMNDVADAGRVVSMGTSETQVGYVLSKGTLGSEPGEGVFTHYFVEEGMNSGYADGYNQIGTEDGKVVVEESFDYAKQKIKSSPYKRQKPVISDNFTDDLLL